MSFEIQRTQALTILSKTGIWRSNYEPPLLRLLWKLGFKVPPPHFVGFWQTAVFTAIWFGSLWGLSMWVFFFSHQHMMLRIAFIATCIAGGSFGLSMAVYYAYGRHKYKLPAWKSLENT